MTHEKWTKWEEQMFIKMVRSRTDRERVEIMKEEIEKFGAMINIILNETQRVALKGLLTGRGIEINEKTIK